MIKKSSFFLTSYFVLSLPVLADLPVSSKLSFIAPEPAIQESSKPNSDNSPLSTTSKKDQLEWSEEPKYRQYSEEKRDPVTGEITQETYGIDF